MDIETYMIEKMFSRLYSRVDKDTHTRTHTHTHTHTSRYSHAFTVRWTRMHGDWMTLEIGITKTHLTTSSQVCMRECLCVFWGRGGESMCGGKGGGG